MPTLNPDEIPPEIRQHIEALVRDNTDPFTLAVEAWNASARYEQGERFDPHQQ